MLKLKGQAESGEWVEFWIYDIVDTNEVWTDAWCISHEGSRVDDIKTSTIQLTDDPCKQMLDEIWKRVSSIKDKTEAASVVKFDIYEILYEMGAKL